MPGLDMPSFRDESDPNFVWIWDGQSHSFVRVPSDQAQDQPDRGHASGGDNDLFDSASSQDGNYFKEDNPLQEGILASQHTSESWAPSGGECPMCHGILNTDGRCTVCHHDTLAESRPMHTQNMPFPQRTPKPNPMKTDLSYPSMLSKVANDALWHDMAEPSNEVGKFIIDQMGHLHYEPGAHADFQRLKQRDHITDPAALGIVTNNGQAQLSDVSMGFEPDRQAIESQLQDAFGVPVQLDYNNPAPSNGLNNDMADSFRTFAHIDEEMAFLASQPNLDSCPECNDVMLNRTGEKVCSNCGHKQPVIDTTLASKLAFLPLLLEGLGAAGGAAAGGAAAESLGMGEVGQLMGRAIGRGTGYSAMHPNQQAPAAAPAGAAPDVTEEAPEGVVSHLLAAGVIDHLAAGAFGEKEVGIANKNMGLDHNPANKEQQGFNEEHGDSPELLKDVDDVGGAGEGDEKVDGGAAHKQQHAMKMFVMLRPLVEDFANDDSKSGLEDPVIKALDDLLEEAFPGYKGPGHDATHAPADENTHSVAPEAPEIDSEGTEDEGGTPDKDSDEDDEKKPKKASVEEFRPDIPMEHLSWMSGQPAVPGGAPELQAAPTAAPAPGADPNSGVTPCPSCGMPHPPGTACNMNPMDTQPNGVAPQPSGPAQPSMPAQHVVTKWRIAGDEPGESHKPEHHPTDGAGDLNDHDLGHGQHPGHDWVDENGQPLQEGQEYELLSPNYAIPDKIVIQRILPDKIVFTVKADLMDYQDEMTKEDLANEGYTFSPTMQAPDSDDGFDAGQQENPVRPGMDSGAQVDDLSSPPTVVSSAQPDGLPELAWLMEDNDPVAVDGQTLAAAYGMGQGVEAGTRSRNLPEARYAGKDYNQREQREFIDEPGVARNADRLDLSGTHYVDDPEIHDAFLW